MERRRWWWAWPAAGSVVMALYAAGFEAVARVGGGLCGQGTGFAYGVGGILLGFVGLAILAAEWSIAMLPGVRRRWVGDAVRTVLLVALLLLPAQGLLARGSC